MADDGATSTSDAMDQAGPASPPTIQPAATIISAAASSNDPLALTHADDGQFHAICYCFN